MFWKSENEKRETTLFLFSNIRFRTEKRKMSHLLILFDVLMIRNREKNHRDYFSFTDFAFISLYLPGRRCAELHLEIGLADVIAYCVDKLVRMPLGIYKDFIVSKRSGGMTSSKIANDLTRHFGSQRRFSEQNVRRWCAE